MRGEPIAASALHRRRFLLLEVPGPRGRSALDESHMEADVARRLATAPSATAPSATRPSATGRAAADLWEAEVVHRAGDGGPESGYRVTVAGTRLAPALLSCGDTEPKAEVRYEPIAFAQVH